MPISPVARQLNNAYRAIVTTRTVNPIAAQNASFAYAQARQQARIGNTSGALAAAATAQAQALSGAALAVPLAATTAATPASSVPRGVPIVENGPPLSADLIVARNEIAIAEDVSRASLSRAKQHYRAALDAYESGDQARSLSEARAAFDAAVDVVSAAK